MYRTLLIIFVLLLPSSLPADNMTIAPVTQRDLITGLVESLGWSFGLPDEPEIEDYLTILNGRRVFKFEAEDIVIPSADAPLAPKEINSFGPFSGKIWMRAPAREIEPELSFLLPISGNYDIRAALTKPGYRFRINDTEFSADGIQDFSLVTFGQAELTAGQQSAVISIPSRGGIDYLLLEAPPVPTIAPQNGWKPDAPLTYDNLAWVITRTFNLFPSLRKKDAPEIVIEAEEAPAPTGAVCCEDRYKGTFSEEWIKTGVSGGDYSHLFNIEKEGVYDLYLNVLGRAPINGLINGKDVFSISPLPYFTTILAGSFSLEKGTNQIDITLPGRAGLDQFILLPRASGSADFLRLTGLPPGQNPTTEDLDRILGLLALIGAER